MVLLTWVVNTFVDRFMSKEFTGFSFLLPSARWLVAEGCVTVSFCVSTTVASTWAAATHSWSYTSKKNVSFPSRVTSQRVSWWCLLKWNPMVFSCSHSNIVAFPFHLFLRKWFHPQMPGEPSSWVEKLARRDWVIWGGGLSSDWLSTCRGAPILLGLYWHFLVDIE